MSLILLSLAVFILVFLGMAVGYIIKGKCLIGGTCGSKVQQTTDGRFVCPSCGAERQGPD